MPVWDWAEREACRPKEVLKKEGGFFRRPVPKGRTGAYGKGGGGAARVRGRGDGGEGVRQPYPARVRRPRARQGSLLTPQPPWVPAGASSVEAVFQMLR